MMMEEEIERTREEIRKVEEACEKVEEVLVKVGQTEGVKEGGTGDEEGWMEDVVSATAIAEDKGEKTKTDKLWFEDEKLLEAWNG
jgi:hypothetical protein